MSVPSYGGAAPVPPPATADHVAYFAWLGGTKGPASEGAHRLAWWLADQPGRLTGRRFNEAIGAPSGTVTRLLSGELEPGDDMAMAIARVTRGAVLPGDWLRGGPLGWLDKPFGRTPDEAAHAERWA